MPTDIDFSLHSLLKIEILRSHGLDVSKEIVENVVRIPDRIEEGYKEGQLLKRALTEHVYLESFMKHCQTNFML